MKNTAIKLALWGGWIFLHVGLLFAQNDNIISVSFGGSHQNISVVNTTDTPMVVTVNHHISDVLRRGGEFDYPIGALSNQQEVLIRVDVCANVEMVYEFESAPDWPDNMNQPDGLPITNEWLRSRPDKDAIKRKFNDIKHFMSKQPGGGDYMKQLNRWKHEVDDHGTAPKGKLCEAPTTIEALTFNRVMWGSYGNLETALTVAQDGKGGYQINNPPRWVY